jgi:ankyrin repeat protein
MDAGPFNEALWRGDHAKVARLASKIDPNGADRWNRSALAMAAQYGDLALVEKLVRRGAKLDQGRTYLTPITIAARRGAADIVAWLRDAGATISIATQIYLGDTAAVSRALAKDASLASAIDEDGTPLLLHAAESCHVDIAALFLDHGASLALADRTGETALHHVADIRRSAGDDAARMATFLIDRGAIVDARTRDDVTPLHQAVRARHVAVATVLLARGADPNAGDKRGSTPLHRAVTGTGASNTAGTAPLMVTLTRLLVDHGGDPDRADARGRTPRAAARSQPIRDALGPE